MATQKQNRRPMHCTITIEYDLPSDYQQAQSHPSKHPSHHGCPGNRTPVSNPSGRTSTQPTAMALAHTAISVALQRAVDQLSQAEPGRIHLHLAGVAVAPRTTTASQLALWKSTSAVPNARDVPNALEAARLHKDILKRMRERIRERAQQRSFDRTASADISKRRERLEEKFRRQPKPTPAKSSPTFSAAITGSTKPYFGSAKQPEDAPRLASAPAGPSRRQSPASTRLRRRATEARASQHLRAPTWRLTRRIPKA